MHPKPEDFRRHYTALSDEALLQINRSELVNMAQKAYDEELGRRNLTLLAPEILVEHANTARRAVSADAWLKKAINLARSDMSSRILFTLGVLVIYWVGACIPLSGVKFNELADYYHNATGRMLFLYSGGIFRRLSIFGLGVNPYFTAWLILQLLAIVVPRFAKILKAKDEFGRMELTLWTRYFTVFLALTQSFGIANVVGSAESFVFHSGIGFILLTMLTQTTGAVLVMWLCEQITTRGIGNGMWLLVIVRLLGQRGSVSWQFMLVGLAVTGLTFLDIVIEHSRQNPRARIEADNGE